MISETASLRFGEKGVTEKESMNCTLTCMIKRDDTTRVSIESQAAQAR